MQFDNIIEEVKRMSYDLMPAVLDEFGLIHAIRNLCEEIETRNNININYTYSIEGDKLNRKVKTYIFRIVQEGLNNIVKHAKATNVSIELHKEDNKIKLIIEDNGNGINKEYLSNTFEPFFDSNKLRDNEDRDLSLPHGKKGIGRFTFITFANSAKWITTYENNGKKYNYILTINENNLNK